MSQVKRKTGRPRRRPNAKFYGFIATIAAVVIAVVFFVNAVDTVSVEQGEVLYEMKVPVVLMRDEQIISTDNYGKANYVAQEGERVEADATVAEVYKRGYNDKVLSELLAVQTSIMQYQEKLLQGKEDAELNQINTQIIEKRNETVAAIDGGLYGDAVTKEQELKELMQKKQKYLKEIVTPDQQLQSFYSSEQQLQERIDGWRIIEKAPSAGVVSYYFDGAESMLNASNIENTSSTDITNILNGTIQTPSEGAVAKSAEKPLFRLVNNFKWYLMVYSKTPIPEIQKDTIFTVAFDEYLDRQYQGKVLGTITEGTDSYIYTIEMTEDIGELLSVRRTDAKIYTKFEGLKVPTNSVIEKDGVKGVNVISGKEKIFVPVTVKIERQGDSIILPIEENNLLYVGQKIQS